MTSPLGVNPFTYLNSVVFLIIFVLSLWYLFKGPKVFRWIMLSNTIAGFWLVIVYIIIFIDTFYADIISTADITIYLIRPALFVIGCVKLGNIMQLGVRRHER